MTFVFCTALQQESRNWPGKTPANWMTLEKEGGHTFWNFNCVFTAFLTHKDLPPGQFHYRIEVIDKQMTEKVFFFQHQL